MRYFAKLDTRFETARFNNNYNFLNWEFSHAFRRMMIVSQSADFTFTSRGIHAQNVPIEEGFF